MITGTRSFIFNAGNSVQPGGPSQTGQDIPIPSNDPVVRLEEVARHKRNPAQIRAIENLYHTHQPFTLTDDDMFDQDLTWAYRCYAVDVAPAFLAAQNTGEHANQSLPPSEDGEPLFQTHLYLFNLLVALEWTPGQRYWRQLKSFFHRASNFLYDVTDGYMAFGQIVFGGPTLMDCADIQIMASNRLLPRSWVGGLHDAEKYTPIRLGRGVWSKNNRISIPWNEPEGYRMLVHELAHYALELVDAYLEMHDVYLPAGGVPTHAPHNLLVRPTSTLVIPRISLAINSIMSSLEGTSELVPKQESSEPDRKSKEWERLKAKKRFPYIDPDHKPLDGPGHLPLPLPRFRYLQPSKQISTTQATDTTGTAATRWGDEVILADFPSNIQHEHCWVYILKGSITDPEHIIAQGSLDARALYDGFRLLGARPDDLIILIGSDDRDQVVLYARIESVEQVDDEPRARIGPWCAATPDTFPVIDVLPAQVDGSWGPARICVQVSHKNADISVFSAGQPGRQDIVGPDHYLPMTTLDGHVMARWGEKFVLAAFSQGGSPPSGTPGGPPPISAGSSEGNIMLFFEDKGLRPDYSRVRVVTTLLHGMPYRLADGREARSYAFSLSSTAPLPIELHPTLVMYFDKAAVKEGGDLIIHRQKDDGDWEPIPTYLPPGASFAAAPLNHTTAHRLVTLPPDSRVGRTERFRLFWTPRTAP